MIPEDIGTIFTLIVIGASILFGLWAGIAQRNKRRDLFAAQAAKRGGEVVTGGILQRLELRLPYKGYTLVIYSRPGSRNSPPRTVATLRPEGVLLPTLDILRNDLVQRITGAFGRERILLDDEEFNKHIVIRGDDQLLARRILTPEMQRRFLDRTLRSLEARISQQNVQIKMMVVVTTNEVLDYFIDTTFAILQKIL